MKLELNINEINIVLQALGNAPYFQVCQLIENIRAQVQSQIPTTENGNG